MIIATAINEPYWSYAFIIICMQNLN